MSEEKLLNIKKELNIKNENLNYLKNSIINKKYLNNQLFENESMIKEVHIINIGNKWIYNKY